MRPSFSLIVLFHSGKGLLKACIESLKMTINDNDEVIIVVNSPNSADREVEFIDSKFRILEFDKALGYSRAANQGAAAARYDYVVFCDHDLVFKPNWLDELWRFYRSQQRLKAVSCCVINPQTNRVLDFGIAYNEFNGAHPHQDLPLSHPLVQECRTAQAVCTGGLLIAQDDFQQLGGFDEKLMTLYSDVDLSLRIKALGHNVGSTPKALAYHFGGCFSQIDRSYKQSNIKADIKGYFTQKNADIMTFDLVDYYQMSAQHFLSNHNAFGKYFYCNLMNVANPEWYSDVFEELGASYYDGVTWASGHRDSAKEGLYEQLGHDIACLRTPIAYFVDRFCSLEENVLWWSKRQNKNDIVIDRNANILAVEEVIRDRVAQVL